MIKFMRKISMFAGLVLAVGVSFLLYLWLNGQKAPAEPVRAVIKAPEKAPLPRFSETIPVGMRAVSLTVDEIFGVSRSLKKGDRVDLIADMPPTGSRIAFYKCALGGRMSKPLAENVEILSFTPDKAGQSRGWPVTLLMTPEQVSLLKSAGYDPVKIRLLARNPSDAGVPAADQGGVPSFTPRDGATKLRTSEGIDLSRRIRPGMRALTVPNTGYGVFAWFKPGDRVDVLYKCRHKRVSHMEEDAPGKKYEIVTPTTAGVVTVLQDVEVIATEADEHWTSSSSNEVFRPLWITLQVSPEDAEKLAFAVAFSNSLKPPPIMLMNRNSTDKEKLPFRLTDGTDAMNRRIEYSRITEIRGMMEKWRPFYKPQPSISDKKGIRPSAK